jgi:ABC-type proline/glycine betaine transport system ATPase subunit
MEKITIDYRVSEHMKRIADALEEILRLVKLDQEKMAKRFPDEDKE